MSDKRPFVIYHAELDGSSQPQVIYVGADKSAAFDALIEFVKSNYVSTGGIHIEWSEATNGVMHQGQDNAAAEAPSLAIAG